MFFMNTWLKDQIDEAGFRLLLVLLGCWVRLGLPMALTCSQNLHADSKKLRFQIH